MIKFGLSKGCKLVVVKCGEDGAYIGDSNKIIYSKAITPRGLLDTTGAGDLYAAGFLYGITHQKNYQESGHLASIASAEVISHFGARPRVKLSSLI